MKNQEHVPCKNRKRETRDGVTMDWCYAIGCCEIGDMPCDYCKDRVLHGFQEWKDKEERYGKEKHRKEKGKAKDR